MEMTLVLRLQIEFWIHLIFVTVMAGFLAFIIINSKRTLLLFRYCFLHTFIIVLLICNFTSMIAPDIRTRWICLSVTYICKFVFDTLYFFRIFDFIPRYKKILPFVFVVLYIATGVIIIITNPTHHLFIKEMTVGGNTVGILYYIMMAAGYIFESAGLAGLARYWIGKLENPAYRVLITISALLCTLFLHLYMMRVVGTSVDFFPLIMLVCFGTYFIGAYKYGMFDTITRSSKRGFEMYTDALLITGNKGNVLYKNKACEMLDGKLLQDICGRLVQDTGQKSAGSIDKIDVEIPAEGGTRYFTVSKKIIKPRLFSSGKTIFIIHENTGIISSIRSLSEKNQYLEEMNESVKELAEDSKRLAVLKERNLMAKEIHDVMGHSLILALNTMESNKLLSGDMSAAVRRIEQAVSEISSSLKEIAAAGERRTAQENMQERSLDESISKPYHTILIERLLTLSSRLSEAGIRLEIAAMDDLHGCDEKSINNIYRVCQESVTNAIKHGQASRITISAKIRSGMIELFIVDNGKGCTNCIKGTGLTGMEERVRELNGSIMFGSFEDQEGFMVRVSIPA